VKPRGTFGMSNLKTVDGSYVQRRTEHVGIGDWRRPERRLVNTGRVDSRPGSSAVEATGRRQRRRP